MNVTINMPDELASKIDKQAQDMCLSRSAYITMTLSQKMKQDELTGSLTDTLGKMTDFLEKVGNETKGLKMESVQIEK